MPANIGVDGGISENGIARIQQSDADRLAQHKLQIGDVIFSRRGDVTRNALIEPHQVGWLCGTGCLKVRLGDESKADAKFISYCLRLPETKEWLIRHAVGATMPNLNTSILAAVPVTIPPLDEQKKITTVLRTLDDRIALLRETNATLEAMAQALFKSWFVDFEPVHTNAGTRAATLPVELQALFPSTFTDTPQGRVPEGWNYRPISDVIEGLYDGPHATPPEASNGGIFLGIRNLTGTGLDLSDVRHIADVDWEKWTKRITPQKGDIVFSYEATLGFFALIPPELRCCLGRRLALIRPLQENGTTHFWFHHFTSSPFQQLLEKHTIHGATVNRIALKSFPNLPVLTPPFEIRQVFDRLAESIWADIQANQAKAQTLAALRDTLLPRLISGQLRLPDAAAALAEAGA